MGVCRAEFKPLHINATTLGVTLAMEAGISDHVWTIRDLRVTGAFAPIAVRSAGCVCYLKAA
jgi:hypothetical protein